MTRAATLLEAVCARDAAQAALDAAALDVSRELYACRVGGATAREIADTLGITTQRVYQLLARAERELREAHELEAAKAAYVRGAIREAERRQNRGMESRAANCGVCGRFKPRPSAVCDHCGDDPVTFNGDPLAYDRERGYA